MASRRQTILLEASWAEALTASRYALLCLGWEISDKAEGVITGDEDFAWVPCRYAPSRIEVAIRSEEPARTRVLVEVSAPGFGPVAGGRLQRQVAAFEEKLTTDPV